MRLAYFLILAIAPSVSAENPFACVNPNVADAFLGDAYGGRGTYSTSVPDGFPALIVPPGWSLIGSQTMSLSTSVVYKANQDKDSALRDAVAAMTGAGWSENSQHYRWMAGGFQTTSHPVSAVICHDDYDGSLSVIAADKSGHTFVSYVQHPAAQGCESENSAAVRHDPSEMMRLLPTLKLPEGVKASNTGMGGNGHEVGSHVDISGALGRSDLSSFFENQIRDQGWTLQSKWSSPHSSGSVWALNTVEDGLLIGILHVFNFSADPIRVRFSVTPADAAKGGDHSLGSWSGTSS